MVLARSRPRRSRITHSVPGRMRVRVECAQTSDRNAALNALQDLSRTPGVSDVTVDARTGSALLSYDPEELDPESVVELVRSAHTALEDVLPPLVSQRVDRAASETALAVQRKATALDRRVLDATHGAIDLRMLLPIGLAGLSLSALSRQGVSLKTVPWYVLAYYSFDTFIKLHGGRGPQEGSPGNAV